MKKEGEVLAPTRKGRSRDGVAGPNPGNQMPSDDGTGSVNTAEHRSDGTRALRGTRSDGKQSLYQHRTGLHDDCSEAAGVAIR